jgi:hypothetical protein
MRALFTFVWFLAFVGADSTSHTSVEAKEEKSIEKLARISLHAQTDARGKMLNQTGKNESCQHAETSNCVTSSLAQDLASAMSHHHATKHEASVLSHSHYSPAGDVICTSLDDCKPWKADAWKFASNACSSTVTYSGPGLQGVPKTIKVFYDAFLDGGGTMMTKSFTKASEKYLEKHGGMQRYGKGVAPFRRGYEWCTGPGFIAFAQLAAGLVGRLFLSDINPQAVKCLQKTVEYNKLQGIVDVYLSKDFVHLPLPKNDLDKLDVVWGNPPNYLNIDPASGYAKQLRPADPGWKTHKAFYEGIRPYLSTNALLMIEEVLPEQRVVTYKSLAMPVTGNYDVRDKVPLDEFKKMAADAGFKNIGLEPLDELEYFSKLLLFEVIPRPVSEPGNGAAKASHLLGLLSTNLPLSICLLVAALVISALVAFRVLQSKVSV